MLDFYVLENKRKKKKKKNCFVWKSYLVVIYLYIHTEANSAQILNDNKMMINNTARTSHIHSRQMSQANSFFNNHQP